MERKTTRGCILASMLVLCLAISCADNAKKTADQMAADEAAITEYIDAYAKMLAVEDIEGWIALWDDNARRLEPFGKPLVGTDQIKASMASFLDTFAIDLKINNEEIKIAGDWGYISGTFSYTAMVKAVPDTLKIGGSYLSIMRRQADGTWKVFRECYNTDAIPPMPVEMEGK